MWIVRVGVGCIAAACLAGPAFAHAAPIGAAPCASPFGSVAHRADARVLTPQPRNLPSACTVVPGIASTFPATAVAPDGVAYTALNDGGVLRSTDGGRTWQKIDPGPDRDGDTHTGGLHGFVTVDQRTGRVFYVTYGNTRSCGSAVPPTGDGVPLVRLPVYRGVFLSYSDNEGHSWRHSVVACDLFDWPKVFVGPPAHSRRGAYPTNVYVAASYPFPLGPEKKVYRSTDGGATFRATRNVASDSFEPGAGVVGPDGTIYMDEVYTSGSYAQAVGSPYPYKLQDQGRPRVVISRDDGDTWTQVALPGSAITSAYGTQRVAVDRAGNVYAVWVDDSDRKPRLVVSRDQGRTWSTPVRVQGPEVADANYQVSVAARLPGQVAISYPGSPDQRLYPSGAYVPDYREYEGYISRTEDALDPDPVFDTARINPLDRPLAPRVRLDDAIGEALGLALGPDGTAWAGFTRSVNDLQPGPAVGYDPSPDELVLSRLLPGPQTGCLNSRGGARGRRLGPAVLGVSRRRHRQVLRGRRLVSRPGMDRYCATGGGAFRIGYPTSRLDRFLDRHQRRRLRSRAVLVLTSSKRFGIRGVRPGSTVATLRRRVGATGRLRVGRNTWYSARGARARLLFATRGGRVRAVGLAPRALTRTRKAQRRLLSAWRL